MIKPTFLMTIYASRKEGKTLDEMYRSAKGNNFRMFAWMGYVYSVEAVQYRLEKKYASMDEAILFKMTELI